MGHVIVRPCTPADLALLRAAWPTVDDVHQHHFEQQAAGAAAFLVAWEGDVPLGVGMVQWLGPVGPAASAAFPGVPELNHLQVREEARGRGVGTALIEAAEALVRDRGIDRIAVGVDDDNPDAARLYHRLGYEPTGVYDEVRYEWVDDDGVRRPATERNELLVKMLHVFVVSVTFLNAEGDLLMVRKRGTHRFMLPGGKVEPGETHLAAILREVEEEVGLTLDPTAVGLLGHWTAGAANEPGLVISSDVFIAPLPGDPHASGEIEELRWLPISSEVDYGQDPTLSPMLTEHVIPALVALRPS
ncbi:MAG: GNAT family N-acetyltransferase [Propionibacteriaceae bacterium]|nr:GNAT family N-acetyltransferase [Propionibacteriaceae bacterium]